MLPSARAYSRKCVSRQKIGLARRCVFAFAAQLPDASRENACAYGELAPGPTYYNYFRDYDPTVGRYAQSDPIGLWGGLNTYGYVGASPVSHADPDGRQVAPPAPPPIVGPIPPPGIPGLPGNPPPGFRIPEFPMPSPIEMCMISPALCATIMMVEQACKDEPDCQRATPWQLSNAGIGNPEGFKSEYVGKAGGRFDICACKDGSVQLKAVGQCGRQGPGITTHKRWR